MKRFGITLVALAAVLAVPGSALAAPATGSDCDYASGPAVGPAKVNVQNSPDASGMSGDADTAVGACLNNDPPIGAGPLAFGGGSVEVGTGSGSGGNGTYAIVDGDNENVDPAGQGDGYIGVSTYENGTKGNCTTGSGTGTNSGGCFALDAAPGVTLPLPIACGNTSGNTWNNAGRDGCSIP